MLGCVSAENTSDIAIVSSEIKNPSHHFLSLPRFVKNSIKPFRKTSDHKSRILSNLKKNSKSVVIIGTSTGQENPLLCEENLFRLETSHRDKKTKLHNSN